MSARRYVSPKREAAAARTRERLVRAAARLLRSPEGLRALSFESVARAARVTRLTVYNQFGSRKGLLEAVFDDRAERGGLRRIPEALGNPDPHAALLRVIEIFCEFWESDRETITRLFGMAATDPDLTESMRARNERRRRILTVLVGRLASRQEVATEGSKDLIDALFALTSFQVFSELVQPGRDATAACQLIQKLAEGALRQWRA
jgi:AcrR family transcriptional regulator